MTFYKEPPKPYSNYEGPYILPCQTLKQAVFAKTKIEASGEALGLRV